MARKSNNAFSSLGILMTCGFLISIFVGVSTLPQWVWNKDAIDNNKNFNGGTNQQLVLGQTSRFPESASQGISDPSKKIRAAQGEARLRLISAIQNIAGGNSGSSGGGGGLGGIFGSVLQTIPQLATQAIGGIFNRPSITLPAKNPDDIGSSSGGNGGGSSSSGGSCSCVSQNLCFLPNKATGSCEGGRVNCCSQTRTLFPGESTSGSTKSERTVTQREIRQGLLKNILKGSRSFVDDALDLILTPYLSTDDQRKIATRVVDDE